MFILNKYKIKLNLYWDNRFGPITFNRNFSGSIVLIQINLCKCAGAGSC